MQSADSTGQISAGLSCTQRSFPTGYRVRCALGSSTTPASRYLPARVSCELSVRTVFLKENALSESMKRRFAEARVFAAQVRARRAMGDKWILAYVQKHR